MILTNVFALASFPGKVTLDRVTQDYAASLIEHGTCGEDDGRSTLLLGPGAEVLERELGFARGQLAAWGAQPTTVTHPDGDYILCGTPDSETGNTIWLIIS